MREFVIDVVKLSAAAKKPTNYTSTCVHTQESVGGRREKYSYAISIDAVVSNDQNNAD